MHFFIDRFIRFLLAVYSICGTPKDVTLESQLCLYVEDKQCVSEEKQVYPKGRHCIHLDSGDPMLVSWTPANKCW